MKDIGNLRARVAKTREELDRQDYRQAGAATRQELAVAMKTTLQLIDEVAAAVEEVQQYVQNRG